MSALTVGRPSMINQPLQNTREHTLGKNPMNVNIVKRPLASSVNLLGIRETILERSYECNVCGKAFSYNTSFIQHEKTQGRNPVNSQDENPHCQISFTRQDMTVTVV